MKKRPFLSALFLLIVALWLSTPAALFCQTGKEPERAENGHNAASLAKEGSIDTQTNHIEKAGERIGQEIEEFSQKASTHVGSWIDSKVFGDISWLKLIVCLFFVFLVVLAERILRWIIQARLRRIPPDLEVISWKKQLLIALSKPLSLFIWAYGIYAALSPLFVHFQAPDGGNLVQLVATKAADIAGAFAILWFFYRLVDILNMQLSKWAGTTESTLDDILVPLVGKTARFFIVGIGGIIIIQNLTGVEIGPLLASLGIGGLAVALAAKDSIANFFGTLTILFDKPFQVGERIVIGDHDGVVESLGFRSTRIRTLTGHLVSIPNEKIVNSAVENIGRRPHIRWVTNIGVTYDTPPEKVKRAVEIIREVLKNHEGMKGDFPPRVHFNGFNDWSLNIAVFAWYYPPDYWAFQAWVEKTCLEIMTRFEKEGLEFAFPTQTVYLANDDKRQLKMEMLRGQGNKVD